MEQVAKLKRIWNLAPVLQIAQKIPETTFLVYMYQLDKFGDLMRGGSKNIFKNAEIFKYSLYTNTLGGGDNGG